MTKHSKVLILLLSITTVIFLYASIMLYAVKESEREKSAGLAKHLAEIATTKEELSSRLSEADISNAELKGAIMAHEEKITVLSRQLEETKAEKTSSVSRLQERELEVQRLRAKIDVEKEGKGDLERRLEKMREEYSDIKAHLKSILKTKAEIERRAKKLAEKTDISLGTILIKVPSK